MGLKGDVHTFKQHNKSHTHIQTRSHEFQELQIAFNFHFLMNQSSSSRNSVRFEMSQEKWKSSHKCEILINTQATPDLSTFIQSLANIHILDVKRHISTSENYNSCYM